MVVKEKRGKELTKAEEAWALVDRLERFLKAKEGTLSQEDVARELNVACATLNRWVNRHNHPTGTSVVVLRMYLDSKGF